MSLTDAGRSAQVLLVEDDGDDVLLAEEALDALPIPVHLHRVENGRACLDFLRRDPPWQDAPTPDLILLDLNMPVMNGHEVLEEMAKDPQLQTFRVVVLTTSAEERDVVRAYRSIGCSSYIQKPVQFDKFVETLRRIGDYWLKHVVKPGPDTGP